jgi:hypothetical protein
MQNIKFKIEKNNFIQTNAAFSHFQLAFPSALEAVRS